jgi:transitional endoplasmic reticulum ATPase
MGIKRKLSSQELTALEKGQTGTRVDILQAVESDKEERAVQRTAIVSSNPTYEEVGGYNRQKEDLDYVGHVGRSAEVYGESYKHIPNRGVYLIGPHGVGKSMLAKAFIRKNFEELHKEFPELEVILRGDESMMEQIAGFVKQKPQGSTFFYDSIDAGQLVGPLPQITEKMVREYFDKATSADYAVVVLERVEGLLPAETANGGGSTIVGHILEMIDHYLKKNPHLMVLATTAIPSKVDSSISTVMTKRIEMGAPTDAEREEILKVCTRNWPLTPDVKLEDLAKLTGGYVGCDLANVCDEAINSASRRTGLEQKMGELRRKYDSRFKESAEYKSLVASQKIIMEDFKKALEKVRPSLLEGYTIEIPDIKLEDVAGMADIKEDTELWMKTRMEHPWIDEACGLPKESNQYWLFVGPPGTGKTYYAKALAGEVGATFISIKGGEVLDRWVGSTEQNIREIFKRAREAKKAVIFWDEIDALAAKRGSGEHHDDSFVNTLLSELEGIRENENIVFIAATNRPDQLDPGFVSRMNRLIYVGLPDEAQIKEIMKIKLGLTGNVRHDKNKPKQIHPDVANGLDELSKELEQKSYSCRDIEHLVKGAKTEMGRRISSAIKRNAPQQEIENSCVLMPEDIANAADKITSASYEDQYWESMAQQFSLKGFKKKNANTA